MKVVDKLDHGVWRVGSIRLLSTFNQETINLHQSLRSYEFAGGGGGFGCFFFLHRPFPFLAVMLLDKIIHYLSAMGSGIINFISIICFLVFKLKKMNS